MKTRIMFMIAVWASLAVGAVTLFEAAAVPVAIVSGLALGGLAVQVLVALRSRRRVQPWSDAREPEFPPGPRRVLLSETGLVRSVSRSRSGG